MIQPLRSAPHTPREEFCKRMEEKNPTMIVSLQPTESNAYKPLSASKNLTHENPQPQEKTELERSSLEVEL